ncbi:hypothetical protein QT397_20645 [Microbulbifer sp. MKSA007]|nr:hypothetical protein QT397_20645 [Microbulbifer sp. MKSA007]
MNKIEQKYNDGLCRVESGIFFTTDQCHRIYFDSKRGYYPGNLEALSSLVTENGEDWWFTTIAQEEARKGEFVAIVGGGSYEGEGFVALKKGTKLQWIIHLESSEVFTEVEIEKDVVIAYANNFPHKNTLTVPIDSPKEFTFFEQ